MGDATSGYFWRGPVLSRRRAERIINWAGGVAIGYAALLLLLEIYDAVTGDQNVRLVSVVPTLVFAGLASLLTVFRVRIASVGLLVMAALGAVVALVGLWVTLTGLGRFGYTLWKPPPFIFLYISFVLGWLTCAAMAWRAVRAAGALKRFATGDRHVAVFD